MPAKTLRFDEFRENQRLSYAEAATRIHQAAQAVSQDKKSAKTFLQRIGIVDQKGELNEAYR
jgi:hypothetical protein